MSRPAIIGRLAALTLLAAAWLLGVAGPAAAHPALISSSPGAGYAVTQAPRQITLAFNEPVTLPDRPLLVRTTSGTSIPLRVSTAQAGAALVGTPVQALPVGGYEVTYRVVGLDGDLITGTFAFGVATPVGAAGAAARDGAVTGGSEAVSPLTTLLRALLFLGVALALGGGWLAWRVDEATGGLPGVQPWLRAGAAVALFAAVGLLVDLGGPKNLIATATGSGVGRLLGLQAGLLAVAALAGRGARGVPAAVLLLLVVVLEGLRAHPGEVAGLLGGALTITHFLAGALWLGGLVHLLRLARGWRARPKAVHVAARTYARNALVLFVLVSVTGTISAVALLPELDDWTSTTYGRLLLLKIGAFLLVVALALVGRGRLRRSDSSYFAGGSVQTPRPLGRPAAVETAVLASVVLAAAAVTTVTPARLVPVSSLLAAPIGPTVRVAERVRQVSVSAVASQGRVELRADVPDDGRLAAVQLDGVIAANGVTRPLELESCGRSCWTARAAWQPGTNTLELDVIAERFDAGPVSIAVPWPAVPAPGLLKQVQQAMGTRTAIDTFETVTSGFGTVLPHRSRRTGQEFLAGQPWTEGGAADATIFERDGQRTLLYALPALGYHFAMQLDDQNRIISERIVTPNHLLTRQYNYP